MNFIVLKKDEFEQLIRNISTLTEVVTKMQQPQPKVWVPEAEAMEILNVSKSTIQKFRKSGLLNYSQYNNLISYKHSDLMKFFENHYSQNRNYVTSKKRVA